MREKQNDQKLCLSNIQVGEVAQVLSIEENSPVTKRLMEMGIVPGVSVKLVKTAPFGSPLEIKVRGYHLALRKSEAEKIEVVASK